MYVSSAGRDSCINEVIIVKSGDLRRFTAFRDQECISFNMCVSERNPEEDELIFVVFEVTVRLKKSDPVIISFLHGDVKSGEVL